jgi:histidine ammonia-lyase
MGLMEKAARSLLKMKKEAAEATVTTVIPTNEHEEDTGSKGTVGLKKALQDIPSKLEKIRKGNKVTTAPKTMDADVKTNEAKETK